MADAGGSAAESSTAKSPSPDGRPRAYDPPPIRGSSSGRFGVCFLLSVIFLAAAWPALSYFALNRFDHPAVAFVEAVYSRKAIAMRHTASKSTAAAPRLVIVAGSSGIFGIDAELMEHELHRPVVNLSTHAGLGGPYILDRARRMLQDGDDVLLAPEYELMANPASGYDQLAWDYSISYDKRYVFHEGVLRGIDALYSQPLDQYVLAWSGWQSYFKGNIYSARAGYDVSSMDARGDLRRSPLGVLARSSWDIPYANARDPGNAMHCFQAFATWASKHRMRVFFTFPPHATPDGTLPEAKRDPPWEQQKMLEGLAVVINRPIDCVYPQSWFTDSVYHVDSGCRRIHTQHLIDALRPRLGLPPASSAPTGIYLVSAGAGGPPGTRLQTFDDHPGTQARYFVSGPNSRADAINIDQISQLVDRRVPVWTDDERVLAAFPEDQWTSEIAASGQADLVAWARRYQNDVIMIARSQKGAVSTSLPFISTLPPGPVVSFFQPPLTSALKTVRRGASTFGTTLSHVTHRRGPNLLIDLSKDSSPQQMNVEVNHNVRAMSGPDQAAGVVFDPNMSVVIDSATFDAEGKATQWTLWRLVRKPH